VEVRWPSGRVDVAEARADSTVTVREGGATPASPALPLSGRP